MATITKHVGEYGGKPCVILFREVPNEPENCLIVQTNLLEDRQHDDLMMVIQSAEGQQSGEINEVLQRRQFSDGTNMLNALHFNRNIAKVPVSMVNLTPVPGQSVALSDVNAEIRKMDAPHALKTDGTQAERTQETRVTTAEVEGTPANESAETPTEPSVAQGLLTQGQLMMEDAKAMMADAESKLAQAYAMDPSLAPKKGPGRPKKTA